MENKRKIVPLRLNVNDKVLLVWRHLLTGSVSKTIKSIIYSYKNDMPFPKYELKQIPLDESMLKPVVVNISFSTNDVDVELYQYVLSDDFKLPSRSNKDMYMTALNTSRLPAKIKELIKYSLPDEVKNQIQQSINEFLKEEYKHVYVEDNVAKEDTNKTRKVKEDVSSDKKEETAKKDSTVVEKETKIVKDVEDTEVFPQQNQKVLENEEKNTIVSKNSDVDSSDHIAAETTSEPAIKVDENTNKELNETHAKKRRKKGVPKKVNIPNVSFDTTSMTEALKALNNHNN